MTSTTMARIAQGLNCTDHRDLGTYRAQNGHTWSEIAMFSDDDHSGALPTAHLGSQSTTCRSAKEWALMCNSQAEGGPNLESMTREVWLHVGPPKSATTTVQGILHELMSEEAESRGVRIRRSQAGGTNHHLEALDLLYDGDRTACDPFTRRVLSKYQPQSERPWRALVKEVADCGLERVVVSAEHLAYASEPDASRAVRELQPAVVHVVLARRSVAEVLVSLHGELCKRAAMPRVDVWLRETIIATLDEGAAGMPWISADWVAEQWGAAGATVHMVEARDGMSDRIVAEIMELLVPGARAPAGPGSNTGFSATTLEIWQDHVESRPPRYAAAALATLGAWLSSDSGPASTRDRWSVSDDVAELVDAAMSIPPDPGAVVELRRRVEQVESLVIRRGQVPGRSESRGFARELDKIARLQNARFWAMGKAHVLARRPRLAEFLRANLEA